MEGQKQKVKIPSCSDILGSDYKPLTAGLLVISVSGYFSPSL